MGVNKVVHFSIDTAEEWHAIGHRLAPKEGVWNDVLSEPGTRSLLVEGKRPDGHRGYIRVKVEPSTPHHPGVSVEVNDHFDMRRGESTPPVSALMDVLSAEWCNCVTRAENIIDKLMSVA